MKVKLFTHIDLDGVGCAILARLAFGNKNVDVEFCDYGDVNEKVEDFFEQEEVYRSYDRIFITDISVSDSIARMIDVLGGGAKVRLFDHHETALDLNSYATWACVQIFDKYTNEKTCGTEMFYKYLFDHKYFVRHNSVVQNNIPIFVDIVRDWDTWGWKKRPEDVGIVSKQMNDLLYIRGRERFVLWALMCIRTMLSFSYADKVVLQQRQYEIDMYIEQKGKQLKILDDFAGNKFGVVFAERDFSELGNKLCEKHPEIAYVTMIDISSGRVHYRTICDDIDLGGEIAHSYGGGGHDKTAGSQFNLDSIYIKVFGEVFSRDKHAVL